MAAVWKFSQPLHDGQTEDDAVVYEMPMPLTARIIHGHIDEHAVYVWAVVTDADVAEERREIVVVGTGAEFSPVGCRHVGTVVVAQGYVWHIFERTP